MAKDKARKQMADVIEAYQRGYTSGWKDAARGMRKQMVDFVDTLEDTFEETINLVDSSGEDDF